MPLPKTYHMHFLKAIVFFWARGVHVYRGLVTKDWVKSVHTGLYYLSNRPSSRDGLGSIS